MAFFASRIFYLLPFRGRCTFSVTGFDVCCTFGSMYSCCCFFSADEVLPLDSSLLLVLFSSLVSCSVGNLWLYFYWFSVRLFVAGPFVFLTFLRVVLVFLSSEADDKVEDYFLLKDDFLLDVKLSRVTAFFFLCV